ncbi:MAG: glutamate-1-semialdehyde 2,1-aminomutase [Aquabacterium sp.]
MRVIKKSSQCFERGRLVIPDGVSSPMRAFAQVGGNPICVASAKGALVRDVDGNEYIDMLNGFGALILGHAPDPVVEAIGAQAALGTVYGFSTELEYRLAERIVASTPAIDQVRFVCSGTEAVMTAARIARAHTGRSLLVKFVGSYHGHSDVMLATPANLNASADQTKGVSRGITEALNREVLLCDYNDLSQLQELFTRHGDDIAAVLVEPIATNMGFVRPKPDFHQGIRQLCDKHGALFIFDEVVTGFRFRFGGICSKMDIKPDLITFGKIIGGGTPIGAFGGRRDLMKHVQIGQSVFQSGTFAANPLTMAAANAALDVLSQPGFYEGMDQRGAWLESAITSEFKTHDIPFLFTRYGALSGIAFRNGNAQMVSYRDVKTQQYGLYKAVHARMLDAGFIMAPSLEEPVFLSAAHTQAHIQRFAHSLAGAIANVLAEQAHQTAQV